MNNTNSKDNLPQQCITTEALPFWQMHLQKQQTSGLCMADYCRTNGLKPHLFYYQHYKRRGKLQHSDSQSSLMFHPVTLATPKAKISSAELSVVFRLPNRIECELHHAEVEVCLDLLRALAQFSL